MIFTLFHFPLVSKDNSQIFHVSGENMITISEKMKGYFYKTCMSTFPHADGGWSDSSFKLNILLCQWLGSLSLPGPRSSEERCGQWHNAPAALGSYSRVWGLSDTTQKQSRPERCLIYVRVLRRSEHGKIQVTCKSTSDFPTSQFLCRFFFTHTDDGNLFHEKKITMKFTTLLQNSIERQG